MLSAGLLLLLFNILGMVGASRETCDPATGTYPDPDSVLNPLAKLIEEKVPEASYACALEPRAFLKFVQLTKEQWDAVYGKVKITKQLKFKTEKPGLTLEDPEGLAKEAVQKWSSDLGKLKGGRFGCVISHKPRPIKKNTTYKLACLFE
ncbi:hypothetical protein ANCCAN_03205 [Ancylostoma caninum]|uniref:SCP domain-containing protein n=1 Tax=Ancylostoma caninum TaxID=29170 RepID=A0A368H1V4_ANCCA|nr:hypothetical protein ANCCAN_03205 [Ancylostoma caninum]